MTRVNLSDVVTRPCPGCHRTLSIRVVYLTSARAIQCACGATVKLPTYAEAAEGLRNVRSKA